MGPRPRTPRIDKLLRLRIDKQLYKCHPLIRLASLMNWQKIERSFGAHFTSSRGRPALSPRLVAGLLYLQHANDASDESVVATWLEPLLAILLRGDPFADRAAH